MASNAVVGVGVKFRRWSGSAWADVAEVNSISGPGMTKETIDVTSLDSTGGYREFIPGFRDGGTLQLTMNFSYATYSLMKTDFDSEDTVNYEIVFVDGTSFEFAGFVTELPLEITPDDKVTSSVTIKITGEVTLDTGGSGPSPG